MTTTYMAYNHNGTPLLKEPTAIKALANKEAKEYRHATSQSAYVATCDVGGNEIFVD